MSQSKLLSFVKTLFGNHSSDSAYDQPAVNTDGTPMADDSGIDVEGKPFGTSDSDSISSEPSVNVDGTPMVSGGAIDVEGKPFGVTDNDVCSTSMSDDFLTDSSSCFDSTDTSIGGMDDSFSDTFDDDW